MARSGAPKVRVSACPALRPERSTTAAAGPDIPAPQPAAALPAIISSICSAARADGYRPAMSRCAGRRSDAIRWPPAKDPARPPCAARRSMATSPARWCEVAMRCAGSAMEVIVSAADRGLRQKHHRADGSRISRSVLRTSEPIQSTSQNPYGSARRRATRGPAARVAPVGLPAPALVRRFPQASSLRCAPPLVPRHGRGSVDRDGPDDEPERD